MADRKHLDAQQSLAEAEVVQDEVLVKATVITVSRSIWMTTKMNGVATDLFCMGVIGHPVGMILNQGPKILI